MRVAGAAVRHQPIMVHGHGPACRPGSSPMGMCSVTPVDRVRRATAHALRVGGGRVGGRSLSLQALLVGKVIRVTCRLAVGGCGCAVAAAAAWRRPRRYRWRLRRGGRRCWHVSQNGLGVFYAVCLTLGDPPYGTVPCLYRLYPSMASMPSGIVNFSQHGLLNGAYKGCPWYSCRRAATES